MDGLREVTLSSAGVEMASSSDIVDIISKIREDDEITPWVEIPRYTYCHDNKEIESAYDDFVESEVFQLLSDDEREVISNKGRLMVDDVGSFAWTIESTGGQELPRTLRRVTAIGADVLLACGVTVDDIQRVSPQSLKLSEILGFKGKVDFANFVGASILASPDEFRDTFVDFDLDESDGIKQTIGIGGSQHGDFRIRKAELYTNGSIDPFGSKVMYAPKGPETHFGAYHSVEPLILTALLKHLDKLGWSDDTQKQFIQKAISLFDRTDDGSRGGGLFSDYGDSDGMYQIFDIQRYGADEVARSRAEADGYVWEELPNIFNRESGICLTFRSVGDDFVIQYGKRDKDRKWVPTDDSCITIPQSRMGDFLVSLLNQSKNGYGRTSDTNLMGVLKARLDTDWRV